MRTAGRDDGERSPACYVSMLRMGPSRTWPAFLALSALLACHSSSTAPAPPLRTHPLTFESGPVRPLALAPDGTRLFVANIPNGSLDILAVGGEGLRLEASVAVGLDPVALAVRTSGEVWVVNHLSDSVSIVDVSSRPPRVARTLLVGDEPSDIVFAGAGRGRAFVTTAHRGQQRSDPSLAGVPGAGDPQLTTAGVGRADVWVFDAEQPGDGPGGRPVAIVTLPGDTPRGLAVTPDGKTVYAAVFKSGNRTTVISSLLPCDGFDSDLSCFQEGLTIPGSVIGPATDHAGVPAPRVGLIVKADATGAWRDQNGRDWSGVVRFSLPDEDVFALDAASLDTTSTFRDVGTTLFNMVVNPRSGKVYVSNLEARNDLRFEGPGTFAGASLQGHLAEMRVTVLDGTAVRPRHLNKHIPYSVLPAPPGIRAQSLSTPLDLVVSPDGSTLYVAAFGSSKVGVFPTAALEDDSFDPALLAAGHVAVSGGGPGGLALDDARHRLYVATRFDDGVSVVDLATGRETAHLALATPEPAAVTVGRPFLYDATVSSSNGEAACASCHMFGDTDHLAWDLGNPDGDVVRTPVEIKLAAGARGTAINGTGDAKSLHPMKGPMATQTLRGLVNHGAMHWRGDRVDGFFGKDTRTAPPYDSELAFKNFIVAFEGLLGLGSQFSTDDMQSFARFALAIVPPPNPVRALDNGLTPAQARGRSFFMGCDGADSLTGRPATCGPDERPVGAGHFSDGILAPTLGFTCEGCHVLDPGSGYFGTDGRLSFEALPQTMKIPQLRNLYERVGMFGVAPNSSENPGNNGDTGPQVRGFGFTNDGSVDTLFRFLQARVFDANFGGRVGFDRGDSQRRDVEAYLLAFDTDLAPIVGQQITLDANNASRVGSRIDLLRARARTPFPSKVLGTDATECDLVVHGVISGRATTFVLRADGLFDRDDGSGPVTDGALRALSSVSGQALTYTCLPPGWAPRR